MRATASINPFPKLLLILALLTLALIAATLSAHALAGHGALAEEVHQCLCDRGPDGVFTRPSDGRVSYCVLLCSGRYGLQVDEADDSNVTAYKTRYLESEWDKLLRYLARKGYDVGVPPAGAIP